MKSSTSRSLAPRPSCSRMLLRRSTARSALESARVWFWQTRQRSSEEMSITRFSRTGSGAVAVSFENPTGRKKIIARKPGRSLFMLEIIDERHDLLRHDLGRARSDLLVADDAALVDHVGFGHAVDAVVDAHLAVGVEERGAVRIAVALEPLHAVLAAVLLVQPLKGRRAAFGGLDDQPVLLA